MQIKTKVHNNSLYVLLIGELDEANAPYVRNHLDQVIETEKGFNKVIVDLSQLDFMDSTGIGVMLGRYKKLQSRNIPIYIINPSRQAEKIFQMAGLYDIMPKIS
ncbi:MAG: STAS domain-containing protein [Clostridia bacterium]|nr:STAS domain-containing protein [Clostridia bacterium]